MADVFTDDQFHFNVVLNKKDFTQQILNLEAAFKKAAKIFESEGFDGTEFRRTAERFRSRRRRLDDTMDKLFDKIADDLIERIHDRYMSFKKKDGKLVGRTGALRMALMDKNSNVAVEINDDFAFLGIMNRVFLSQQTATEKGLPYYIYQNQAISPAGPRSFRHFITTFTGAIEQIRAEDQKDIEEKIVTTVERVLSEERLR